MHRCMYSNEYIMGIYTFADYIILVCPTLFGIQKMLQICEVYAFNYKITFNATKSKLLYFSYFDKDHSVLLSLTMKDGNVIPYVSKCEHLGNTIYTTLYRDNAIDEITLTKHIHIIQQQNSNHTQTHCKLFRQTIHKHCQTRNKLIHQQSSTKNARSYHQTHYNTCPRGNKTK